MTASIDIAVPLDMLKPCSGQFLVRLAAARNGVPVRCVKGRDRSRKAVDARHEAMTLIFQHTVHTTPAVARMFGAHHTTVLYALRKRGLACVKLCDVPSYSASKFRPKNRRAVAHG